ncbi:hypothetical protein L6452_27065 [Arctium lappa]|uniref:Uncharacterized protein n=1 Tax=Arctium lappa TaxID=4217 RepID=A0ACB8ZVP8_ARCLA|nr:hypothetical protein L6452_27065 [Arctium lappa]
MQVSVGVNESTVIESKTSVLLVPTKEQVDALSKELRDRATIPVVSLMDVSKLITTFVILYLCQVIGVMDVNRSKDIVYKTTVKDSFCFDEVKDISKWIS